MVQLQHALSSERVRMGSFAARESVESGHAGVRECSSGFYSDYKHVASPLQYAPQTQRFGPFAAPAIQDSIPLWLLTRNFRSPRIQFHPSGHRAAEAAIELPAVLRSLGQSELYLRNHQRV